MRAFSFFGAMAVVGGCHCSDVGVGENHGECVDEDGDGFGAGCEAGDDCDDTNAEVGSECPDCPDDPLAAGCPCDTREPSSCYTGPEGTLGVGECRSGLRQCREGTWSACEDERTPGDEEKLGRNGDDDDCNGLTDDRLCGEEEACGGECCTERQVCLGTYCGLPNECGDEGECRNDTRCVDGACIPWEENGIEKECLGNGREPLPLEPEVQCSWPFSPLTGPVIVIDLDNDELPELVFVESSQGWMFALHGDDCTELWHTDPGWGDGPIPYADGEAPIAAGDLEGDGDVEIAVATLQGAMAIFDHQGQIVCRSADPGGFPPPSPQGAMAIANVDGEGDAEVLLGMQVFDPHCQLIWGDLEALPPWGQIPVVADVDLDGQQELVTGNRIFNAATGEVEAHFVDLDNGLPAVANIDPTSPEPEIVVIAPSGARIQDVHGNVIFGPYDLFRGVSVGWGGPPTIADFDGDGLLEFSAAGATAYVVFDPDCAGWGRDGACAGDGVDGITWQKETVDLSSGATASSVFDFDGDGMPEVAYGDECFLRIYDGATGATRFITPNGNGTLYEFPTIADVDGDGNTEIVSAGFGTFPTCGEADAETGTPFKVTDPGIRVWRDVEDRWAPSRRIWNQHAYNVTNVEEDGRIPETPENNWDVEGLNNFRVNTTDVPTPFLRGIDLTTRGAGYEDETCPEYVTLRAVVSNRGTEDVMPGAIVAFYADAPPELGGTLACETGTVSRIPPGDGVEVSCDWMNPGYEPRSVFIRADPWRVLLECNEGNNDGDMVEVHCDAPG